MITSLPSVVWDARREGKIKFHFSPFMWLARPVRLKIWLILGIFQFDINSSLKSPSRNWITPEFVKKSELNLTKAVGVYADHIFIHSILRNKSRYFYPKSINQWRQGQGRTYILFTRQVWKSTVCPLPDWMKLKYFLYWLTRWSLRTFNRQLQQLLDNNNNSSSSSTSYLDQIMSIMADNILTFNLICKIDLNPEILRCVDSPLIIHLLPSNKNFFGWIR